MRASIELRMDRRQDLGRELFRWELATAIAGSVLGVNPFDEPNVTEAKLATSALLAALQQQGKLPEPEDVLSPADGDAIRKHVLGAGAGDYVAFSAYFVRTDARQALLTRMRLGARDATRAATTLGYGPRFLHSTGQLHKGGPNTGLFVQVVDDAGEELAIPGKPFGFRRLIHSQAAGDLASLEERGRRIVRIRLEDL